MCYWDFLFVGEGTTLKFKYIFKDMCTFIIAMLWDVIGLLLLLPSFSSNRLLLTHLIQTLLLVVEVEHDGSWTAASLC